MPVPMRLLVLHGPNLNFLGRREPGVYGTGTLGELDAEVRDEAARLGLRTRHLQSNHEGALIDALQAADDDCDGVVFNPGAYTHTSYALRDAIASLRIPVVEVHLSDIHAREPWRAVSLVSEVCLAQVAGRGVDSYIEGLRLVAAQVAARAATESSE
jgi:3-dehydroquinate dehydratase-2